MKLSDEDVERIAKAVARHMYVKPAQYVMPPTIWQVPNLPYYYGPYVISGANTGTLYNC